MLVYTFVIKICFDHSAWQCKPRSSMAHFSSKKSEWKFYNGATIMAPESSIVVNRRLFALVKISLKCYSLSKKKSYQFLDHFVCFRLCHEVSLEPARTSTVRERHRGQEVEVIKPSVLKNCFDTAFVRVCSA